MLPVAMLLLGLCLTINAWWSQRGAGDLVAAAIDHATRREIAVRPAAPVIAEQIRALNRLETAHQVTHHVVQAKAASPLLGDFLTKDELVLTARGEVTAGVDFEQLQPGQIQVAADRVTVQLPRARILDVHLSDEHSQVVSRERGLLAFTPDRDLERQARLQAVGEAERVALQRGILDQAQTNAAGNLTALIHSLGYAQVDVAFVGQG
jgi:hypothetical protein